MLLELDFFTNTSHFKFFDRILQPYQFFVSKLSINSKIFFLRSSDVGLSVTTTKEGLFDEALIKPQEPSSKENLTPINC